MDIGFIFNGALTKSQDDAIRDSGGVRAMLGDDLSSLDKVVYGAGVNVPEGDYELVSFTEFNPEKEESASMDAVDLPKTKRKKSQRKKK